MYYSKLTGGFYSTEIHGSNIPEDAVELTEAQYSALIQGLSRGKIIVDGVDGPALSDPPAPSAAEVRENDLDAIEALVPFKQRGLREWFLFDAVSRGFITEAILDPATLFDKGSDPFKSFPYMLKANILQERAVRARKARR